MTQPEAPRAMSDNERREAVTARPDMKLMIAGILHIALASSS
jgi:hypothetical protein